MVAKFAWNAQKNKMSDVVGKEREQNREGRLKNEDIDLERSHLNYDLINDDRSLYRRVNDRVLALKENGSRVQKNSVVMYSNIITLPKEYKNLSEDEQKKYFEVTTDYFKNRFGEENVVSAKVHLDESTPHMHLHFVPVNEEGRLSARTAMSRQMMNEIHNQVPKLLNERGFEIERGDSKNNLYIENVHEFKKINKAYEEKIKEIEKEYALKKDEYELKIQKQNEFIKHLKMNARLPGSFNSVFQTDSDGNYISYIENDAKEYLKKVSRFEQNKLGEGKNLEINPAIESGLADEFYINIYTVKERGEEKEFSKLIKDRTGLDDDELLLEIKTKSRLEHEENYRNLFLPNEQDLKYLEKKQIQKEQQKIERMNQLKRSRGDEMGM